METDEREVRSGPDLAAVWPQEAPQNPLSPLELVPHIHCTDGETETPEGGGFSLMGNLKASPLLARFPIVFHCVSGFIGNICQQMLIFSSWHPLTCHLFLPFSCHPSSHIGRSEASPLLLPLLSPPTACRLPHPRPPQLSATYSLYFTQSPHFSLPDTYKVLGMKQGSS